MATTTADDAWLRDLLLGGDWNPDGDDAHGMAAVLAAGDRQAESPAAATGVRAADGGGPEQDLVPAGGPPRADTMPVSGERMDLRYAVGVLVDHRDLVRRLAAGTGGSSGR